MANNTKDKYESFKQLRESCEWNKDYSIDMINNNSPISVIAIHGGGVEAGTTEVARALAMKGHYNYYSFIGERNGRLDCPGNLELHITSNKFLDTWCLEVVGSSIATISVHGADEIESLCYVGGKNFIHAKFIKDELRLIGVNVPDIIREGLEGYSPLNICNRNMKNMGIQLELSQGLRKQMFSDNWKEYAPRKVEYEKAVDNCKYVFPPTKLINFTKALFIANQKYLCTL